MLYWALVFFVVAIIAGDIPSGFTGIFVAAAGIAKILFFVFIVLPAIVRFTCGGRLRCGTTRLITLCDRAVPLRHRTLFLEVSIMIGTILLIILILILLGSVPAWPHSRSWGYYPSGGVGCWLSF